MITIDLLSMVAVLTYRNIRLSLFMQTVGILQESDSSDP